MAKDFRTASQLPDDFVRFDFGDVDRQMADDAAEVFGEEEAERLRGITFGFGFTVDSNMTGTKDAVETAAMYTLKARNGDADLSGITVEALNPHWMSFRKDGWEFAKSYGHIEVNEKYMDYGSKDGSYPLIPTKSPSEALGCSWIEEGDPEWKDFERVEKALSANKAEEDDFAAGVESISAPGEGLAK